MNPNRIAVGLDIGTTKIAALVGRYDAHRKLEILGYGTAPSLDVQRGVVVNITQTIESIQQAIAAAQVDCGMDISGVVVNCRSAHPQPSAQRLHYPCRFRRSDWRPRSRAPH